MNITVTENHEVAAPVSKDVVITIAGEGDKTVTFKDSDGLRAVDMSDEDIIQCIMDATHSGTISLNSRLVWDEETDTEKRGTLYTQAQVKGA